MTSPGLGAWKPVPAAGRGQGGDMAVKRADLVTLTLTLTHTLTHTLTLTLTQILTHTRRLLGSLVTFRDAKLCTAGHREPPLTLSDKLTQGYPYF